MLLSFSRGAWINLGVAVAIYGALHILTVREQPRAPEDRRAGSRWASRPLPRWSLVALQFDAVSDLASRARLARPELRRGARGPLRRPAEGGRPHPGEPARHRRAAVRAAVPPRGAAQRLPEHVPERRLARRLHLLRRCVASTGVCGLRHAFVRCATQPLFLVVYACFVANALEGVDHRPRPLAPLLSADGAGLGPDAERDEGRRAARSRRHYRRTAGVSMGRPWARQAR